MLCPFCRSEDTQVKDSRPSEDGASIRRRRQCGACDARFTTFERVQLREISVMKRDGRKVIFSREKLERSFTIALRKRAAHENDVAMAINEIVRKLESTGEADVTSDYIGSLVMKAGFNKNTCRYDWLVLLQNQAFPGFGYTNLPNSKYQMRNNDARH